MSEYLIVNENKYIVQRAAKSLAEDEHWSGYTDKRLWAKAIAMTKGASENLRPAVSEDRVLYTNLLRQEGLKEVLDRYSYFRGKKILALIQSRNAELQYEIKRAKEIHKLYIKHHRFDHFNNTSRYTRIYFLALLIVILIAVLLGGNGA